MNTAIQQGLKRRTIKQIIKRKLAEWLKTLPGDIRLKVEKHIIVTGGCIASMLLGESIKDFDIYLDNINTVRELAIYYVRKFNERRDVKNGYTKKPFVKEWDMGDGTKRVSIYIKSSGAAGEAENGDEYRYFEGEESADGLGAMAYVERVLEGDKSGEERYRPVFLSENAISLSDKVQIVIRFYGPPNEIHKNYDYVHATNYYHSATDELVLRPPALESLLSRALVYQGSLYPVCSLFRMRKFMERGWRISAGEITKMAMQISQLDLTKINVLREQLIGVDAAYFHELLNMLQEFQDKNEGKPIDASYVMQLIDEMAEQEIAL